jgi:hypothetical protein
MSNLVNLIPDERLARLTRLFLQQAGPCGFSIERMQTAYTYLVQSHTTGQQLRAYLLASTFDYYEYRIYKRQLGSSDLELLVVQEHNAIVGMPVLCLRNGTLYPARECPDEPRADAGKRNQAEVKRLVSRLLVGDPAAHTELATLPLSTQKRYLRKRNDYLDGAYRCPWTSPHQREGDNEKF